MLRRALATLLCLAACNDKDDTTAATTTGDSTGAASTSSASASATATTSGTTTSGATTTTTTTGATSGVTTGDLPPGTCHNDADCGDPLLLCFHPGEANCGPCQADPMECTEDAQCTPDVCETFALICACSGDVGHECRPACTPDTCPEDKVCDEGTGHCVYVSCDGGPACPPLHDCVPGSGGNDCVRWDCAADAECDGGFCVEGRCYDQLGNCEELGR